MDAVAKRISKILIDRNMSIRRLGVLTGIPPATISRYVGTGSQKIPLDKLELIAKALNVSPAYLMGMTGVKPTRAAKSIAKNIRSYREEAGISSKEFAQLLLINEETVLAIESACYEVDRELTFKICDALHITPDFLDGIIVERIEQGDVDAEYSYWKYEQHLKQANCISNTQLTSQEDTLLRLFRETSEEGRMRMIQSVLNIHDAVQKSSDSAGTASMA